jgi:hypothetical protein
VSQATRQHDMQFSHGRIEIQHTKMLRYNKIALALCARDAILFFAVDTILCR